MSRLHALKRWMYKNDKPHRLAKIANRLHAIAATAGHGVNHVVTLEVRGRRSGQLRSFPVVVADYQGERYLVAMLGQNTNWIRNVHAADGHVVLRHGRRDSVRLAEIDPRAAGPILKRYLEVAPGARPHIPVDRFAPLEEFERIAAQYPVFCIHADSVEPPGQRDEHSADPARRRPYPAG